MRYEDVINELKKKIFHPVYFLYGKESYYIDLIADYIGDNTLPPEEQAFNQFIFYGKDSDLQNIVGQAKKFPMMSNHQVIIVREAQSLKGLTGIPTKTKANPLLLYCQNPLLSTILVFCYKIPPDSSEKLTVGFTKGLGSKSVLFESKQLYDREMPAFVQQYVKSKNYSITPKASALLIESVGNILSTIVRELDKLFIALPAGKTEINETTVEQNIGISREYNIFELQNKIASGDVGQSFKISHYLAARQSDKVIFMISKLFEFFTVLMKYHVSQNKNGNEQDLATDIGVNKFFLRNYISGAKRFPINKIVVIVSLLREYDLKCKGLGANEDKGELFKELVAKIMYV